MSTFKGKKYFSHISKKGVLDEFDKRDLDENGCYKIPDGVTKIKPCTFFTDGSNIKAVVIPDSVIDLEKNAFSDCSSIEDIKIPDSVCYIGSFAFSDCTNLKSITIPKYILSEIGYSAFRDCKNLTWINDYYVKDLTSLEINELLYNKEFATKLCNHQSLIATAIRRLQDGETAEFNLASNDDGYNFKYTKYTPKVIKKMIRTNITDDPKMADILSRQYVPQEDILTK